MKPKIILATTNNSKIAPFLFAWNKLELSETYELLTFKDIESKPDFEVEKNTGSFEKDALKKAVEYAKYLNLPTISIDRGLEIPSLDNWPGTNSKDVLLGFSEETKGLVKEDRSRRENEIEIARYIIDKIKDEERKMNSVYGIAISLPNGESASDLVVYPGKASKELVLTDHSWNYDWFYIPDGLNTTLSSLSKEEYIEYTGNHLWTITDRVVEFIESKIL